MYQPLKIIVLTPVKNEEWILNQFLSVTSLFADCIIIADQNSTDGSRNICKQFSKVHLIENKNEEYDEAERQLLLINTARNMFPKERRILFALDTDEIFSSDSLTFNTSWEHIKTSSPGTTIYCEKPDILPGLQKCIRHRNNYFPIGYVDDGTQHTPKLIHSRRLPVTVPEKKFFIDDIKILHFALSRRNVLSAKHRYYTVIENLRKTTPWHLRRKLYKSFYDEHKFYFLKTNESVNENWLREWDDRKINFRKLDDPKFSWQDFEVLKMFKTFGYKKFYFENIWRFDWEVCRQIAFQKGKQAPLEKIKKPNIFIRGALKLFDISYNLYSNFKILLTKSIKNGN